MLPSLGKAKTVAVVGAGGKTTLLARLAAQRRAQRVLLTTTTHIFPFSSDLCRAVCIDPDTAALTQAQSSPGVVCAGTRARDGKLTALPHGLLQLARSRAHLVLYEADGAKCRPLKLHNETEPVLLPDTDLCILVAGLSALGQPVGDAVHRFDRRPDWAADPTQPVTPDILLACVQEGLAACGLPPARCFVLLNQADTPAQRTIAQTLCAVLRRDGTACGFASLLQEKPGDCRTVQSE